MTISCHKATFVNPRSKISQQMWHWRLSVLHGLLLKFCWASPHRCNVYHAHRDCHLDTHGKWQRGHVTRVLQAREVYSRPILSTFPSSEDGLSYLMT